MIMKYPNSYRLKLAYEYDKKNLSENETISEIIETNKEFYYNILDKNKLICKKYALK